MVKDHGRNQLLDKIGPSMDRHPKLVHYVHQVGYKICEGHGETVSWGNELVWV